MDSEKILEIIHNEINNKHWFGEGTGGSGHMASIYLSEVKVLSQKETKINSKICLEIVYFYKIIRESEFGGQIFDYEAKIILSETGEIMDNKITSENIFDLLSGDEIIEEFPDF